MTEPVRFKMTEMTPDEAGRFLRQLGETCAVTDKWDAFQEIATQFIGDAYKAGQDATVPAETKP